MRKKSNLLFIGAPLQYWDFIDFNKYDLHIVCTTGEKLSITQPQLDKITSIITISSPSYFDATCMEAKFNEICISVEQLIATHGILDNIIGFYEHTILVASKLRHRYNLRNTNPKIQESMRNKVLMKSIINERSNIKTPAYIETKNKSEDDINNFVKKYDKVVIKPINQAASKSIIVTSNMNEVVDFLSNCYYEMEIEEFIDGTLLHIDGVVQSGSIEFLTVSEYFRECLNWESEQDVVGSSLVSNLDLIRISKEHAEEVIQALDYQDGVFHLECFLKNEELIFLEIAGRCSGGCIPELLNRVYNVDLYRCAYNIETGKDFEITDTGHLNNPISFGGTLLFPAPKLKKYLITSITSIEGFPKNICSQTLPKIGHHYSYDELDAFYPIAKFIFKDTCQKSTLEGMKWVNDNFDFSYCEVS